MALTKVQGPSANSLILSGTTTANGNETVNGSLSVNGTITSTGLMSAPGLGLLLRSNSGTDSSAGATNVDSLSLSGLTALDTIKVFVEFEVVTANVAGPIALYSSTDSVQLTDLAAGTVVQTSQVRLMEATLRMRQGSSVNGIGIAIGNYSGNGALSYGQLFTLTTAWTGVWTLTLRHAGVSATGTFKWSWTVYKIAGQ